MSLPLTGGTPATLLSGRTPVNMTVDETSIYWTESGANGSIVKIPLAGGAPTTLASGQGFPYAIAVDGTSVYWTTTGDGTVMKVTPK